MKTIVIIWVLISAPLSLGVIGWGLTLIFHQAGMVAFLFSCVVLFTGALAVAALIDEARQTRTPPQRDR